MPGAGPAPADAASHEAGKCVCSAHRVAEAADLLCIMLPKSIFRLCVILAFWGRRGGVLCPWWSRTVPCPRGESDGRCLLAQAGLSPDARGRDRDCGLLRCLGTRSPWQTCSAFTAEKLRLKEVPPLPMASEPCAPFGQAWRLTARLCAAGEKQGEAREDHLRLSGRQRRRADLH